MESTSFINRVKVYEILASSVRPSHELPSHFPEMIMLSPISCQDFTDSHALSIDFYDFP